MALMSCNQISLAYEQNIVAKNLTFTIGAGDYLGIVGENGSGKTTLMKALLSLKPLAGGIITFGEGLSQTEIGYLPQQTTAQRDFPASVWEVVLSGCQSRRGLLPFYGVEEKNRALQMMERMSITAFKKRSYRELSGGQQQRVLLARALCATQKIILMDEPTSGLDPMVSMELYHLIDEINQEGITVVTVSHDIENTVKYASHILHLQEDCAYFFGDTHTYENSHFGQRFLDRRGRCSDRHCAVCRHRDRDLETVTKPPQEVSHGN